MGDADWHWVYYLVFMRLTLLLLFLQMPGTALPLLLLPDVCFTVFPFGLTLEGQYIIKNLVLITAGIVGQYGTRWTDCR